MIILALDLATATGWAIKNCQRSGVMVFGVKPSESPGMRFFAVQGMVAGDERFAWRY